MSDSETALGDRVESTLPTILSASSRGQLPTRMGGELSEKGEQREQVDVTSDETAMEKWGSHDLEQAEAESQGLLLKGPCIQESPGGDVLRRYTYMDTKVVTPNRLRPRCFSSTKPQCLHYKSSSKYPGVGKGNCTGY